MPITEHSTRTSRNYPATDREESLDRSFEEDHRDGNELLENETHKVSKNQQKKQKLNVVFNYSDINMTEDMIKVLNKGLNYSILPDKVDNTLVLTEFRRFERSVLWKEFWSEKGSDDDNNKKKPIFKIQKNNFPNFKASESLKSFLASIKSELMDPLNRKQVPPNLSKEEYEALTTLSKLQKEKKIIIKQCDKGAGIIVLNYNDYIDSCNEHLSISKVEGTEMRDYYEKVDENEFIKSKERIREVLEEARDNDIIDKDEYDALNPNEKPPSKFYCTFKVHKEHDNGKPPPVRPIVSASGSSLEIIGNMFKIV